MSRQEKHVIAAMCFAEINSAIERANDFREEEVIVNWDGNVTVDGELFERSELDKGIKGVWEFYENSRA